MGRSWRPRRSCWNCCSKRAAAVRAGWLALRPDWTCTGRCRSGFTREWAGPAGQFPPAVQRCRLYRIRG
ncbi:hypothetical protein CRM86_23420 [Pseudomonas putida]|nr:hypothetical protein CRM86_23420 [Pseudomonas putida]